MTTRKMSPAMGHTTPLIFAKRRLGHARAMLERLDSQHLKNLEKQRLVIEEFERAMTAEGGKDQLKVLRIKHTMALTKLERLGEKYEHKRREILQRIDFWRSEVEQAALEDRAPEESDV